MPLIVIIKVVPNAGRQLWQLDKSGMLKCWLKSAPEKGRANCELVQFLAKSLKVSSQAVELLAGSTSRHKKIRIDLDISLEELLDQLGVAKQTTLF